MPNKKIAITNKTKQLYGCVKASDIRNGKRHLANLCPIAMAMHRRYDNFVGVHCEYIEVEGVRTIFLLPKKAKEFVSKFDSCQPVKPFSFLARRRKPRANS